MEYFGKPPQELLRYEKENGYQEKKDGVLSHECSCSDVQRDDQSGSKDESVTIYHSPER